MPTPHISAEPGDFAEAILLPGDPLRAAHIAETFIEDARQVNAVRNMLGFTGSYKGMPVSVMGTGMGIPSASIYLTELVRDYGCKRLVRVGSAGGISAELALRDIVVEKRFFVMAIPQEDGVAVEVLIDVDDRTVLSDEGDLFIEDPWRFVYLFNQLVTSSADVVF